MKKTLYCWSRDGERYRGGHDTREDALAAAQANADEYSEPGTEVTLYTGVQRHAMHFLRKREARIGERIVEMLDEWILDDIASDDVIVDLIQEKHAAFGKHILDWLEAHASFNSWAVDEVQEASYVTRQAIDDKLREEYRVGFDGPPET